MNPVFPGFVTVLWSIKRIMKFYSWNLNWIPDSLSNDYFNKRLNSYNPRQLHLLHCQVNSVNIRTIAELIASFLIHISLCASNTVQWQPLNVWHLLVVAAWQFYITVLLFNLSAHWNIVRIVIIYASRIS